MGWSSLVFDRGRLPEVTWGVEGEGEGGTSRCRKRLYLRRRGAHSCWASPMMRMSSRGSWETCGVDWEREVVREPGVGVCRAVEGEWEVEEASRGS